MAAGCVLAATPDYLGLCGYILTIAQIRPHRCPKDGHDGFALPDQVPSTLLRALISKTEDLRGSIPSGPLHRPLSMTR